MINYEDHSYRKLRRLCRAASGEERLRLSAVIANYYKNLIEKSIRRQHPDWSTGQLKVAVFERMYRNDFTAEEMKRIMAFFLDSRDSKTV